MHIAGIAGRGIGGQVDAGPSQPVMAGGERLVLLIHRLLHADIAVGEEFEPHDLVALERGARVAGAALIDQDHVVVAELARQVEGVPHDQRGEVLDEPAARPAGQEDDWAGAGLAAVFLKMAAATEMRAPVGLVRSSGTSSAPQRTLPPS